MKIFQQLWFRFSLWVSIFVVFAWLVFSGLTLFIFKAQLNRTLDNSLELSASQALGAINIENGQVNLSDSLPDFSSLGSPLEGAFLAQILDPSGTILYSSGKLKIPFDAIKKDLPLDKDILFSSGPGLPENQQYRAISVPLRFEGHVVGTLRIFRSVEYIEEALGQLLQTLLLILPFFILFSFAGSALIARRSLYPIHRMIQKATSITEKDLHQRLPRNERNDEVQDLAFAFNQLLDRLERAFSREKRFSADASHELRTPLTAIQAIIGSTLNQDRSVSAYKSALKDIQAQTSRLIKLSNDLLFLAKYSETEALEKTVFDLSLLMDDLVAGLESLAEEKGIVLRCQHPATLPVIADQDALTRVLYNLVGNAIKYTESGSVSVDVQSTHSKDVTLLVSDTGVGIPSEQLNHIFERFYRGISSRTGEGTGLGLALVKEIVDRHNGRLEVESTVGRGTKISVILPIKI